MKKVVVKLDLHDDNAKRKALKKISTITGIDSIAMDMKEKKLTVIGDVDPVNVVSKLRKTWGFAEILSVGPAKEEKKEDKKEENKDGKKDDENKPKTEKEQIADLIKSYKAFNPHMTQYYYVQSIEENPNACVIS